MGLLMPPLPPGTEVDDTFDPIMMMVMLDPRGKGRPRADRGRVHTDDKTEAWAKDFKTLTTALRLRRDETIQYIWEKPLCIVLECYFRRPQKPQWFCTSSVDNDNAEKMVWDACQDLFFKNDNRIVANCTFKAWAGPNEQPHIKIRIHPLRKKTIHV